MRLLPSFLFLFLLGSLHTSFAQAPERGRGGGAPPGALRGKVLDAEVSSPVAYANVVLLGQRDSVLVTGTITGDDGRFLLDGLKPGLHALEIRFMGYETLRLDSLQLRPGSPARDLGVLALHQARLEGEELTVRTDRAPIEYHIDRKVVTVDRQLAAAGGTAVEILETVPSVDVSIDGTVSLRGSTSFTVLVDGRPSVLDANDALEQMPASSLESIEIITNPSARYDPQGRAGMINLVTRKQKTAGVGLRLNTRIAQRGGGGGDVTVTRRGQKFDLELAVDANRRVHQGSSSSWERTVLEAGAEELASRGQFERGGRMGGLRTGLTWRIADQDVLRTAVRVGGRKGGRESLAHLSHTAMDGTVTRTNSRSDDEREGRFASFSLDHEHKFGREKHLLAWGGQFSRRNGDETSEERTYGLDGTLLSGSQSTEEGPSREVELNLDYTLPLDMPRVANTLLETGLKYSGEHDEEQLAAYSLNPLAMEFQDLPGSRRSIDNTQDILAAYALLSAQAGPLGIKGGLRVEHEDLEITGLDSTVSRQRTDPFPSLHISWEPVSGTTLTASGSRRIERPNGWYLDPGITRLNSYSLRQGNPALDPEYVDAFELGLQRPALGGNLSAETWLRTTHDLIEFRTELLPDGTRLQTPLNAGEERSVGAELGWSRDLLPWWNLNVLGSLSRVAITADAGVGQDTESNSWNGRLQNRFTVGPLTRLQLDGSYHSPTPTTQGESAGFASLNVSVRQQTRDRRFSLTLSANDLLDRAAHEQSTTRADYQSHSRFQPESPSFQMVLSYSLDPERRDRERPTREMGGFDDEGF
jgi:outer membrane receptor protein involved in Fe transport